jgi:hypothetical protein
MDRGFLPALAVIGVFFGMVGGIAAFLNAYEGYRHFPAIAKKRRILISLEFAVIGFLMAVVAVLVVFYFTGKISE